MGAELTATFSRKVGAAEDVFTCSGWERSSLGAEPRLFTVSLLTLNDHHSHSVAFLKVRGSGLPVLHPGDFVNTSEGDRLLVQQVSFAADVVFVRAELLVP